METIAELPADNGEVPHAAGAGGLPPLVLHRPAVLPDFSCGESAAGACLLLDVERRLTTPDGVSLVPPFNKGTGYLRHSSPEVLSL